MLVASPLGGVVPIDPNSLNGEVAEEWQEAINTLKGTSILGDIDYKAYDAVVLPGGHGPMFDLAHDQILANLLQNFAKNNKVIGAVCHGPAGLVSARLPDGRSIIAGRRVTGFTNAEEKLVQLDAVVPFLLEDRLKELGADFLHKEPWNEFVVVDENIITGQNPQSSLSFAKAVIAALE